MGRFTHRFEDQSRPLGKHDASAETAIFIRQVLLTTVLVAFLTGTCWLLAGGDAHFFLTWMHRYF